MQCKPPDLLAASASGTKSVVEVARQTLTRELCNTHVAGTPTGDAGLQKQLDIQR